MPIFLEPPKQHVRDMAVSLCSYSFSLGNPMYVCYLSNISEFSFSLLAPGSGVVYLGHYKGQAVAVKLVSGVRTRQRGPSKVQLMSTEVIT
jgi:hypothetical protein